MAKKGQKYLKFTAEKKDEILKKYFSGVASPCLSKEYGVSQNTIRMWSYNLKHGKGGRPRGRPKQKELSKEDYKERYEILKKYQAFLEARQGKK